MPTSDPDPETADGTALEQLFLDNGATSATYVSRAPVTSFNSNTLLVDGSRLVQKRWRYNYNVSYPGYPPGTSYLELRSIIQAVAEEDPSSFSVLHTLVGCGFWIVAPFAPGGTTVQSTIANITLDPDAVARVTYDPDDAIVVPDVSVEIDMVNVGGPYGAGFVPLGIVFPTVTFNATT
jgi:hypothetical protein